jgi:hypothetical protein
MTPKPKTKATITERLQTERKRLEQNLAPLNQEDMLQPGVVGEWSVKDILAHLADWEEHFPVWVEATRHGGKPAPEPGLTWKELGILNQRIYERHRLQTLDEVLDYFHSIHTQFMQFVDSLSDEELLTPGYYKLTGKGSLYNWLGAYANHDKWGKTHILKWMKARKR